MLHLSISKPMSFKKSTCNNTPPHESGMGVLAGVLEGTPMPMAGCGGAPLRSRRPGASTQYRPAR